MQKQGPIFTLGVPDSAQESGASGSTPKHSSDEDEEDFSQHGLLFEQPEPTSLCTGMSLQTDMKPDDLFIPSVGIVVSTKVSDNIIPNRTRTLDPFLRLQPSAAPLIDNVSLSRVVQNVSICGQGLTHSRTDLSLDVTGLMPYSGGLTASVNSSLTPSPLKTGTMTPEITVESATAGQDVIAALKSSHMSSGDNNIQATTETESISKSQELKSILSSVKLTPPNTLQLARKLSHSSDEVDRRQGGKGKENESVGDVNASETGNLVDGQRSASVRDLSLNITSSQSESAIKSIRSGITNVITSPAAATKDLVLSPFSKFAKGMQNLGANLDPRKLKAGGMGLGRQITEHQMEEHRRLQEKWRNCRTRLIAL